MNFSLFIASFLFSNISEFTKNDINEFLNSRLLVEISEKELIGTSSIDKMLLFISESLNMNFNNFTEFFKKNNFEIKTQNLWIFSSIGFLFGRNTSLEI
ncbi:MAG: hypothetical protein MUE74_13445, partial [Bacteroidales bacterium]|nr:hypothetical protein [Bacteroidales bacterium]